MKAIPGFLLVLVLSTALWAQTIQCVNTWTVEDFDCDGTCDGITTFQPPCTGTYCMNCEVVCEGGGHSYECKVKAELIRSSDNTHIWTCQNWSQDPPACGWDMSGCHELILQEGSTYKLSVCSDGACPGYHCDCEHCHARASVWFLHL